jgi:hypothetical protein
MVYLALDSEGAREAVEVCSVTKSALWVTADSMLEADLQAARQKGISVTNFSSLTSNATSEEIRDAVGTIREHHPSETIWIQDRTGGH